MLNKKQKELVELNYKLIFSFLNKKELSIEDYYSFAAIGLCNAAKDFNKKECSFSTLAYKYMDNEVIGEIRKELRYKRNYAHSISIEDIDEYKGVLVDNTKDVCELAVHNVYYESVISMFETADQNIILMLLNGHKQSEISCMYNVSQSYISRLNKEFELRVK